MMFFSKLKFPTLKSRVLIPNKVLVVNLTKVSRALYTKPELDIGHLQDEKVFTDYFPLHDGDHSKNSAPCARRWLHRNWAQYKNIMKRQPLNKIREYFGEKVALYFTFIGFYTTWLIWFSLVGGIVLIHGLNTYQTDTFVNESCTTDITMCPLCDEEV